MSEELTVIENEYLPVNMPILERLMAAAQAGMSIEILEKFMDLAERNEKRGAEKAFHKAFAAFKADPPEIVKDKAVNFGTTHYKHATIGNVVGAIIAGMSKHGLSHRWNVKQDGSSITVTCYVTHELGHSEETSLSAGADQSGGKNAIQAIASTVTYLERYTLQAATGIAVLEDDDDGRGADDVKLPPKKNLKEAQQNKADPVPKTKADSNPADRATIDKGLSWLKGFEKMPNFTVDQLTVEWEAQSDNIKSMPQENQAELGLAKNKLELFLINRESGIK